MLDDRSYMQAPEYRQGLTVTAKLMIAIVAVFFLQALANLAIPGYEAFESRVLAISRYGLKHGYLWQLITFQFLHAGLLHLALNLITIYFFATALEEALGPRRMLTLYFTSGVVGGLFQVLLSLVAPHLFGGGGYLAFNGMVPGAVVGASAGAFGLVAAYATLFPERTIMFLAFFIIPISLRARTLLWISIGLVLLGVLIPEDRVADGAHLGGLLAGMVFARNAMSSTPFAWRWPDFRGLFWRQPRVKVLPAAPGAPRPTAGPTPDSPPLDADFISREIDPILDKINAQGIQSLTERERRILEAAHDRFRKR